MFLRRLLLHVLGVQAYTVNQRFKRSDATTIPQPIQGSRVPIGSNPKRIKVLIGSICTVAVPNADVEGRQRGVCGR